MKVEQLADDFGNGELFFAGESAFSEDFHEDLDLDFLTIVRKYRYRCKARSRNIPAMDIASMSPGEGRHIFSVPKWRQPYPLFFCSTPR